MELKPERIESAAEAIYKASLCSTPWETLPKSLKSTFLEFAEAALATIPETRELTDEQLTAIDAMHDRGDFGLHVYTNLRNLFTRHPAPAPESAAPTVTKLEYQEDPQDDEANSE
jgi:hypothetical protein